LDPLADKALVALVALPLAWQEILPPWLVVIIVGRDVALVCGVLLMRVRKDQLNNWSVLTSPLNFFEIKPTKLSKANTFLQVLLLAGSLTSAALEVN
jgi:cardiolipin synthase